MKPREWEEKHGKPKTFSDGDGYKTFCNILHPMSSGNGVVYYHRHLMALHLNRWLKGSEQVYFINRSDPMHQSKVTIKNLTIEAPKILDDIACRHCGKIFSPGNARIVCCCVKCRGMARRKFDPTPDELYEMVWDMPTVAVAEILGVSDVAVAKRCKKYGLEKPPRGYWAKVAAGKI